MVSSWFWYEGRSTDGDLSEADIDGANGMLWTFSLLSYLSLDQYLIANLGFSHNFAKIELDKLTFPTTMSIDYIRVYQRKNAINIGCDPKDFPTAAYIEAWVLFS